RTYKESSMKLTTVLMALAVGLSGQIAFGQTDDEESRRGSSGAIFVYRGSEQTFRVPAGVHMLWVEAWGGGGDGAFGVPFNGGGGGGFLGGADGSATDGGAGGNGLVRITFY